MNSIRVIVQKKKCVSCGACNINCPNDAINFIYSKKEERYLPHINKQKCNNCGLCRKMCPKFNEHCDDLLLGNSLANYLAYSIDNKVREEATSGGVVNSIVRYLVENKYVDAAFIVSKSDNEIESDVKVITLTNISEMKNKPRNYASRYVTVPLLKAITLDYEKIAIVGTPCQIHASTLLACEYRKRIVFRIGIACSAGLSYEATKQYKHLLKMEKGSIYYRGKGWPGKNSLYSGDEKIEVDHLGSLFERMYSSQIFKLRGCRTCNDQFASMSDISVCDYWDDEEKRNEKIGKSCVIVRNKNALNIWEELINQQYVNISKSLSNKEVIRTQRYVLVSKKNYKSFWIRCYYKIVDIFVSLKIYKLFNFFEYEFLSRIYGKILVLVGRKYEDIRCQVNEKKNKEDYEK